MKKTIYVAISSIINGDSFDLIATFDENEANDAIDIDKYHLTEREMKRTHHWIDSCTVEVKDGESAEEAYKRLLREDEWL